MSETHQETIAALRLPGPASDSFQEFVADQMDSLLADRARMEKALAVGRTLADAVRLHGYPVSDEHWRKSSGSMSHQARALHLAATAFRQALDGASQ